MTGRLRMGMMVIVPALAKRQQRYPEAVPGGVTSRKPSCSPHMSGRVHQPGGVEANDRTKEDAPQDVLPSTRNKNNRTQHDDGHPVPPADPRVEFVFAKFGNIRQQFCRIVMHGPAREDPAHVGPETAVARRMRVTLLVCVLLEHTMFGNRNYRSTFQSQRA